MYVVFQDKQIQYRSYYAVFPVLFKINKYNIAHTPVSSPSASFNVVIHAKPFYPPVLNIATLQRDEGGGGGGGGGEGGGRMRELIR